MDTSKTYIKMCEKSKEIQEVRREEKHEDTGKWLRGDFYGNVLDSIVTIVTSPDDAWADEPYYLHHPVECIWLPRQDQLQEMLEFAVGVFKDNFWTTLSRLNEYAFTPNIFNEFIPLSMEQLWLAFVMKEKYNKTWSGSEWVLIPD